MSGSKVRPKTKTPPEADVLRELKVLERGTSPDATVEVEEMILALELLIV